MSRSSSRPAAARRSPLTQAFVGLLAALAVGASCDAEDDAQDFRKAVQDDLGEGEPSEPLAFPIDGGEACQNSPTVFLNIGNHRCTGVMIAPDMMLTAGHCVRDGANLRDLSAMSVGTGAAVCDGSVNVNEVFVHPDFSSTRGANGQQVRRPAAGDLALVRLSAPVPGATVATLGTAIAGSTSAQVTMTGFSRGSQNCSNATVTATQFIQTGPTTSQPVHVIEGDLNPDGTRANACVGDSGGPVYLRGTNVVVGINSQVGDIIPGLPRGTVGGPTITTCTPPLYAAFDWQWVQDTLAAGTGGVVNACTPGATEICMGPGDTCGGEVTCGRITCGENNRWGECVRTVDTVRDELHLDTCNNIDDDCDDTIDEDCNPGGGEPCPPGQTRDPNTNLCTCAGFCPFGAQMDPTTCQCTAACGDGICSANESVFSCAIDCDDGGGSSCICGWDCPPNDPACSGSCGDGMCDVISEDSTSCPKDCDFGGSCICGWDCPPNDPACAGFCGDGVCDVVSENSSTCPVDCNVGGGGGGGGGGDYDMCGDWDFWDWYVDEFGWDEAMDAYEAFCAV